MKIKLKKGLNLNIEGALENFKDVESISARRCALVPDDYPGFTPKVDVKPGDSVKIGTALMHDKTQPDLRLVSPLAGTVVEVNRGDRRKLLSVVVEASDSQEFEQYDADAASAAGADSLRSMLGRSGLLALLRERPYDIVPRIDSSEPVRDIFVTAIDSSPLAAPMLSGLEDTANKAVLESGIKALSALTSGKVYVSVAPGFPFGELKGAEMVEVEGPHPAGLVGSQIAAIAPINKGERVWTLDLTALYRIGYLMRTGRVLSEAVVALVGPEVEKPGLVRIAVGASMEEILRGRLRNSGRHQRVVSGNVLTGVAVDAAKGFLRYPYRQVTVIAEGDDVDEFMGWASFSPFKMSTSTSFPGHFLGKLFAPDARLNGGRRAMIMSGQYDKYVDLDIMAEYLLKAIISRNIDDMEKLGIYEVAPEDFALAEYADTSKLPLQQIVRDGLDYLRKELE